MKEEINALFVKKSLEYLKRVESIGIIIAFKNYY